MRKSVAVLACVLLAAAGGCSRKQSTEPPVATPSVSLNKDRAAIGSPLKVTYKFEPLPNARFDGDYAVFVHVMDPEGEKLWQDDHQPPVPTSKWQAGQPVEYTRTIFVPAVVVQVAAEDHGEGCAPAGQHLLLKNARFA